MVVQVLDNSTGLNLTNVQISVSGVGVPDGLPGELADGAFLYQLSQNTNVTIEVSANGYDTETRTILLDQIVIELTITLTPVVPEFTCEENLLANRDFESGIADDAWEQMSTSFSNPIVCCRPSPGSGAYRGNWWVWFGGFNEGMEESAISQTVTIPTGTGATLRFYLEIPESAGEGSMVVSLDDAPIFTVTQGDRAGYSVYTLVEVDLPGAADGASHSISFAASTGTEGLTSFFVDEVCLTVSP